MASTECIEWAEEKGYSEAGVSAQSVEVSGDQVQYVEAQVAVGL